MGSICYSVVVLGTGLPAIWLGLVIVQTQELQTRLLAVGPAGVFIGCVAIVIGTLAVQRSIHSFRMWNAPQIH